MGNSQQLLQIQTMIFGVCVTLVPLILLTAILVFQNARQTRLLKSIEESLRMIERTERTLRRAG